MTKGQWIVVLFAAIGVWITINLIIGLFINPIEGKCVVTSSWRYPNPANNSSIEHEILQCGNEPAKTQIKLAWLHEKKYNVTTVWKSESKFVHNNSITFSMLPVGVMWSNDSEVYIYLPMDAVNEVSILNKQWRETQIAGITIKLKQFDL